MKLIRRISLTLVIALAVVFGGAIVLFNWSVTGWKALAVPTGSMRPTINPGALVLVHSVPDSTLKVGDVITYANPTKITSSITHRIISISHTNGNVRVYTTKGDGNPTADRPVVSAMVKGKAVWHVSRVGAWLSWTHTWVGVAVLVYLPALLVIFEEMRLLIIYFKLTAPYKAAIVRAREKALEQAQQTHNNLKLVPAAIISFVLLLGSIFFALPVHALLSSNIVRLAPNRITVVARTTPPPPPPTCPATSNSSTFNVSSGGSGSTTIIISNGNSQTAQTGNATATNGGSATSGNATNCNSTNINVNVH